MFLTQESASFINSYFVHVDSLIFTFTALLTEIGELQNLQVLDVMNNKIRCLPQEVTGCSQLERLLVDRNQLSWLPNKLVEMPHLQEISASGNQLLYLPLGT